MERQYRRTHINGDCVLGEYDEGVMSEFALRTADMEYLRGFDLVVTGFWGHTEGNLADLRKIGVLTAFDGVDRPFDPARQIAHPNSDIVSSRMKDLRPGSHNNGSI